MKPSFLRLASAPTLLAALFLAACAGTTTSSVDPVVDDAGGPSSNPEADSGVADASKKDDRAPEPKSGPVAVMNLSYVNDPASLSTEVTFVLKNAADQPIEKIRSVKLLFDGTEVTSWGELESCSSWNVFQRSTSPVLTMSVATYDTDDYNRTAAVTCGVGSSDRAGVRPRATRSAIGKGTVRVVMNGVLSDATAFVAQADAPAP